MKTVICPNPAALVEALIKELSTQVNATAESPFTIALSGGSTPKLLYRALPPPPRLDWKRLELFFGDERAVPPDHPESNYKMVKEALLDRLGVTAHRMPSEEGDADGYAQLLRDRIPPRRNGVPVFDLVLLGVGPDGHTASLFPGSPELAERERLVVKTAEPHLGVKRMSITLPVINAARRVWVLAAGADKTPILRKVMGKEGELPIQQVKPIEANVTWWLDEAAMG